jgi:hypothetical protein
MDRVIIGIDPRKASVTNEARDTREVLWAKGRFGTDNRQYKAMSRLPAVAGAALGGGGCERDRRAGGSAAPC